MTRFYTKIVKRRWLILVIFLIALVVSLICKPMVQALTMSTTSIFSSGLTTVIGFLALCLMQFGIGPDLGLALAKGVAISLITVFIFMPALILTTYKLFDKTRHRSFMPSFKGLGTFSVSIMKNDKRMSL